MQTYTDTHLAIITSLLLVTMSTAAPVAADPWYAPVLQGGPEYAAGCAPAEIVLSDLAKLPQNASDVATAHAQYVLDIVDWAIAASVAAGSGNPSPPMPGAPDVLNSINYVVAPGEYHVDTLGYELAPNDVMLAFGPVTITAAESIVIDGQILQFWDALGDAPAVVLAAPTVELNGAVQTASGLQAHNPLRPGGPMDQPGTIGDLWAAGKTTDGGPLYDSLYQLLTGDPGSTQWIAGAAYGVGGRDGGDVIVLSPAFSMGPDSCIATGDGGDGKSLAFVGLGDSGSDDPDPLLAEPFIPPTPWVGGSGGKGGDLVIAPLPSDIDDLQGAIYLGDGGDGGAVSALGGPLIGSVTGGSGGDSGAIEDAAGSRWTPAGILSIVSGGTGGDGGSAWVNVICDDPGIDLSSCEEMEEAVMACLDNPPESGDCVALVIGAPGTIGYDNTQAAKGTDGNEPAKARDGNGARKEDSWCNGEDGVHQTYVQDAGEGTPAEAEGGDGGWGLLQGGDGGGASAFAAPGGKGGTGQEGGRGAYYYRDDMVTPNEEKLCDGGDGGPGGNGGRGGDARAKGGAGGPSPGYGGDGGQATARPGFGGQAGKGGTGGDAPYRFQYACESDDPHGELGASGIPGAPGEPGDVEATGGVGGDGELGDGVSVDGAPHPGGRGGVNASGDQGNYYEVSRDNPCSPVD